VLVSNGYENIYERGFCNGLTDAGISFMLVSSDRTDYAGLRTGTRTVNLRGSQEESRPAVFKLLNLAWYHLRLMAFVLRYRPAVLHSFGLLYPPALCGVVEGLLYRLVCARYVLTVHDLLPHDRHTRWNRLVFGWSFRIAETLIVHTAKMREQLVARFGVDPARVVVMEHGIEPQVGSPALPRASPVESPRLRILFFGKVLRYKGIDVLLSALENFPAAFELIIAGAVRDDALQRELRSQIEAHPQREAISWGERYVPEAEIAGLFAWADLLVLPYRHIDQSGILFQSLRHGVPVVATRVGAFADYVSPRVGELCAPDDAADLRAALLRLQSRLKQLSRAAIVEIAGRYEWSRTVEPLRAVYQGSQA
jgi:glycosyltransferase involved in cell wall biosynthesis